jgi:lysyl-tRNA synthetase class 2
MKFKVDDNIFQQFPSLNIGVIVARGIDNTGESPDVLSMLTDQSNTIKTQYNLETLKEIPKIHAWREAYSAFGAKPKKYTCSVENLYRMILEGIHLRHINKVVDIYNYISLKHAVPVGGDDIDKIDGDIVLRFARGNETFIRLNSDEVDHPKEGEVIYANDKEDVQLIIEELGQLVEKFCGGEISTHILNSENKEIEI